jgi:hypothetical protein
MLIICEQVVNKNTFCLNHFCSRINIHLWQSYINQKTENTLELMDFTPELKLRVVEIL